MISPSDEYELPVCQQDLMGERCTLPEDRSSDSSMPFQVTLTTCTTIDWQMSQAAADGAAGLRRRAAPPARSLTKLDFFHEA